MKNIFWGVLILALFVLFVLAIRPAQAARFIPPVPIPRPTPTYDCAISNPGEGWSCYCEDDITLSESSYGFEVLVSCPIGRKTWTRGCYGNVIVYAIPGVRNILCIEWGIP